MRWYHHLHIRKRLEPYPARKFWLRVLDRVVMMSGMVGVVMTLPQLSNIYIDHNAAGVSAVSWGSYALLDLPWILYAVVHKEPSLIITYILWFALNALVAIGAFLY